MQEKEINILHMLDNGKDLTQRDIARKTGMSLGMVNALIKRCVKKGLVKIERLNSRSLKYILTPEGIKKKTRKTLSYIKRSYNTILQLSVSVKKIAEEKASRGKEIWVLGQKDEIHELITRSLKEIGVKYKLARRVDEIDKTGQTAVIYWEPDLKDELTGEENDEFESINILLN